MNDLKNPEPSKWFLIFTYCSHIQCCFIYWWVFNTLRPRQNVRHFPDDIFACIILKENVWISPKIALKFVLKVPVNNIPSLVQIMAWRRPGDTPLSEPMMVSLLTHIGVTRLQWVNFWVCIGMTQVLMLTKYNWVHLQWTFVWVGPIKHSHGFFIIVNSWWRDYMDTISAFLALCAANIGHRWFIVTKVHKLIEAETKWTSIPDDISKWIFYIYFD